MRTALTHDSHRLKKGSGFPLGGVFIPCSFSIDGAHSDGDVLLHALTDMLLSPFHTDIGQLFPNTDPQWKNADSQYFLNRAFEKFSSSYSIMNIDMLILCDQPKISPHILDIRFHLAFLLQLDLSLLTLRGKTTEGASPFFIQAYCNTLFQPIKSLS